MIKLYFNALNMTKSSHYGSLESSPFCSPVFFVLITNLYFALLTRQLIDKDFAPDV